MFQQIYNPLVPVALRGPLLTDQSGLPRYWSAIWSVVSSGQLAASTHTKKLRYIEDLYAHADRLLGKHALDDALGRLNETALAEILESWFVSIRNRSPVTRSDEKRWQTGLASITSTVTWLSTSGTSNDRLQRIEQRIHRLSTLYNQLHVHKSAQAEIIRSLPATTVEWLYQTLDPASADNPFKRARKRWCVFVAFVLMLHQGLRRGEMLLLPADVIKSEYDHKQQRTRRWLSVRENKYAESDPDPRYSRPQIKTVHSSRQVPVSELTATLVQSYAENYRGRPNHSFLLNAQSNRPLSTETLTSAFKQISGSMPPRVLNDLRQRTGKESISPQDLRHTSAVVRLPRFSRIDWLVSGTMRSTIASPYFAPFHENVRMSQSTASRQPIIQSAGADEPVHQVIARLPPLPSVIRYYDEFEDTARAIRNPADTDKFEVWINGTRSHIDFGRLEKRGDGTLLKHLFTFLLAQDLSVQGINGYIQALSSLTHEEITQIVAVGPTLIGAVWARLRARNLHHLAYPGVKGILRLLCQHRLNGWSNEFRAYLTSNLPLPAGDKYASVRTGTAFLSIDEEAAIVRYLDEMASSITSDSVAIPPAQLADACMLLCAFQFAMRPVQIAKLTVRNMRVWKGADDDLPAVHLTFHMAKQKTNATRRPLT